MVAGTRLEARCLADQGFHIVLSGADPARARAGIQQALKSGIEGLVSFGLGGGLAPELEPGDLVLADAVRAADGADLASPDPRWSKAIRQRLRDGGLDAHGGPVAGSERLIESPARKSALHAQTGALLVDMESHLVAQAAAEAGVAFIVLRAVADAAGDAVPAVARHGLSPDGAVRPLVIASALLRRPGDLPALLRLALVSRKALRTLRRVAALGGPTLGLG